ncbi:MAG: PPC domain-containing protein [Planktothrix sp. GU0601_MAG3]|nr:MAG: PPC domain-containing protein [Planktothrix sp. GU0601_MAG3]
MKLKEGDQVLASDKSLYDEYTFEGKEGQQITISLESSEFDAYLALFNSDNELLQEHDDISQTNSNAEITITLPKTGTYRVIVNAYDSKGRGKYLLKIK